MDFTMKNKNATQNDASELVICIDKELRISRVTTYNLCL